jgi:hypothetical protein
LRYGDFATVIRRNKCFCTESRNLEIIVPTKKVAKFTGAMDNHDSHL